MKITTSLQQTVTAIPAGTYKATLKAARLHIANEYQSDARYQAIELHWAIEGAGQLFIERFVRFVQHEKSTLTNRVSALIGRDLLPNEEVVWDVDDDAERGQPVDVYDKEAGKVIETRAEGVIGWVEGIAVGGTSVLGRSCLLALRQNEKGHNRAGAEAAAALPRQMA